MRVETTYKEALKADSRITKEMISRIQESLGREIDPEEFHWKFVWRKPQWGGPNTILPNPYKQGSPMQRTTAICGDIEIRIAVGEGKGVRWSSKEPIPVIPDPVWDKVLQMCQSKEKTRCPC